MAGTSRGTQSEPQVAVPVHLGQKPKRELENVRRRLSEPVPVEIHRGQGMRERRPAGPNRSFPSRRPNGPAEGARVTPAGWAETLPVLERLEAEFRETAKSAVESLEGVYPGTNGKPRLKYVEGAELFGEDHNLCAPETSFSPGKPIRKERSTPTWPVRTPSRKPSKTPVSEKLALNRRRNRRYRWTSASAGTVAARRHPTRS